MSGVYKRDSRNFQDVYWGKREEKAISSILFASIPSLAIFGHFRHVYVLRMIWREMVPLVGLEPTRVSPLDFESSASTNFATGAHRIAIKDLP